MTTKQPAATSEVGQTLIFDVHGAFRRLNALEAGQEVVGWAYDDIAWLAEFERDELADRWLHMLGCPEDENFIYGALAALSAIHALADRLDRKIDDDHSAMQITIGDAWRQYRAAYLESLSRIPPSDQLAGASGAYDDVSVKEFIQMLEMAVTTAAPDIGCPDWLETMRRVVRYGESLEEVFHATVKA